MNVGDRVQTRYGPGTISSLHAREIALVRMDDDGQDWPYGIADITPLAEEQLQLEPEDFGPWVQSLRDQAEGGQAR